MLYTLYDTTKQKKNIIQVGDQSDPTLLLEGHPDWDVLLGIYADPDRDYVINRAIVHDANQDQEMFELERRLAAITVDSEAENVRGLFITNTPTQSAVYLMKESEAREFLANLEMTEAETPNLTLEAKRTKTSREVAAQTIVGQANMWRQISAQIEYRRLSAKDAIRAATNMQELTDITAGIDWADLKALASS